MLPPDFDGLVRGELVAEAKDIGQFPERRKPQSFHCALTTRSDVMSFNEIFEQLTKLMLAVYAPAKYILASKRQQYIDRYNEQSGDEKGNLSLEGRESGLQRLMTVNLLKRLESSVQSFRLTLQSLQAKQRELEKTMALLAKERQFNRKLEINAHLRQLKNEYAALSR